MNLMLGFREGGGSDPTRSLNGSTLRIGRPWTLHASLLAGLPSEFQLAKSASSIRNTRQFAVYFPQVRVSPGPHYRSPDGCNRRTNQMWHLVIMTFIFECLTKKRTPIDVPFMKMPGLLLRVILSSLDFRAIGTGHAMHKVRQCLFKHVSSNTNRTKRNDTGEEKQSTTKQSF